MAKYKPLMPAKEIEKRKAWQEKVYQQLKRISKKRKVTVLGKKLIVLPGVFAPMWADSKSLAKAVKNETRVGDKVLDLGTGTGIQGIFAAEKASEVVAADISPQSIKCAKLNAKNLKLERKMAIVKSDLFSNTPGRFDLIIFNPPFRWFRPRDLLERGELDMNYVALRRFFREARRHLSGNGRILLVFATSGDLKYLKNLIKRHKFNSRVVSKRKYNNWAAFVYLLT